MDRERIMNEERYLGLDVGTKRVGVAISDRLFLTAQPLKTLNRQPEISIIEELSKIIKQEKITLLVLGLPKNMDGSIGFQAQDVQNFAKRLEETFTLDIIFEDERLSSKQAERFLTAQNKKPSKNKGLIDVASATIILQQYLDKRRIQNGRS